MITPAVPNEIAYLSFDDDADDKAFLIEMMRQVAPSVQIHCIEQWTQQSTSQFLEDLIL